MMVEPLFLSVIVPVYNGEQFLGKAIQSITQQDYHPLEIIIVNDGSTDKTAEVAEKFKGIARYIYQNNAGPSTARNTGLKMAQGDLIAFLDADDLWVQGSLEKQIAYLKDNPEVEIVQGHLQNLRFESDADGETSRKMFGKPRVSFNIGSAIYRKAVFDRIGLFNEELRHSEDVEFLVRVKENGINWVVLDTVVLLYRRHKKSTSAQYDRENQTHLHTQSWLRILKQSLDRRRQNN